MKNKKLFRIFLIILGVMILSVFNNVQAAQITSAFTSQTFNRATLFSLSNSQQLLTNSITLQRIDSGYKYNETNIIWKFVDKNNQTDMYYCLNKDQGFSNSTEAEYNYATELNFNDLARYATNSWNEAKYNKILWILDNVYIPSESADIYSEDACISLLKKAGIDTKRYSDIYDLQVEDIITAQRLAIWNITNDLDVISSISGMPDYDLKDQFTGDIILSRKSKIIKLYNYLINNTSETYKRENPTLEVTATEEMVIKETQENYILGPYNLSGENTDKIISIQANSNIEYILLDKDEKQVTDNNFKDVIGNNFYLKISKEDVESSTQIKLNLSYKYDVRIFTYMTNILNYEDTQPVVIVRSQEITQPLELITPIKLVSIDVEKVWNDNNNQDNVRPNSVEVQLYQDGIEYGNSIVLNKSNNWKYTWEKLLYGYTYTVKELNTTGVVVENNEKYNNDYTATYSIVGNKTTITNTHIPETINVSGIKTWVDNNNQDGKRPEKITINLFANGKEVYTKIVTKDDNWSYEFTNLPKYENGVEIDYTIDEEDVAEYEKIIDRYNITNKYTPGKVSKKVVKAWEDGNNSDGIRPEEITVKLYKLENNQEVDIDIKVLNESNNWTYTWKELDEKANGEDIVYGIREITFVEGYETIYSIKDHLYNNENTITITNIHISQNLAIQVQKIDEQGNVITSSETEFKITGKQDILDKTNQGILNLDSQKLLSNTFEFDYTIKETEAPIGYNGIVEDLTVKISGTTKLENGKYLIDTVNITDKDGNALDNTKILAEYDEELNKVVIKIVNTKLTNTYSVKLVKVGEDGQSSLENAWFKIDNGQAILISKEGNEIATGVLNNENELNLVYKLEEMTAPEGYIKIENPLEVKIKAKVELKDKEYQITEISLLEELDGVIISEQDNVITIKVKNEVEITGKYNVILRKADENGNILNGSTFEINGTNYELPTGEITILENADIISEADIPFTYSIKETTIPQGYNGIKDTVINIRAKVKKEGNNYRLIRALLEDEEGNDITDENISVKIEGNSIVITVKNTPVEKVFDLALRKFITKVNDIEYFRSPIVDTSTIASTGTATYKHVKQPIAVQKGDVVTYTIRVYNEGELDGYVDKITDYLPNNILPIIQGIEGVDIEKYKDEVDFNSNWLWSYSEDGKTITTTITSKLNTETYSILTGLEEVTDTKLDAYVEGSNELDYIDVQIKCLVADTATSYEYLTNIAEITESQDINGIQGDGIDSTLGNVDYSNLADYKNNEAINSTVDSYIEGQEDDDDFEKLIVKEFDLSLRKFITKVNEVMYARVPVVDTSKLGTWVDEKLITTATYNHSKAPVIVETGDIVTYTIRIYNEGTLEGFANEITDDIPEGLEFLPNSDINVSYKWKMLDNEGNVTEDVSKAVIIVTDYLSDADANNIINHVTEENGVKVLDYKDVEVQFKVVAKPEKLQENIIINEAQISADSDRDIDSNPNRDEKYDYDFGNNEDDIDYEPIKLKYFDLALRKFITKVNNTEYNNRYPEIKYNEDESITYTHTKDPVLVTTKDTVVYTIRVYNEGEKAGYATEIKDNLPEGLAFDPENEINKQYSWKMLDSQGNVTEDASKVVAFSTDYLKDELIDAFVNEDNKKILSYKDVQIAFIVVEANTSDRILVNTAEILNDSDDDIDSIPGNNELTEDDIDREYVRVQYFDLALKKWVTRTEVTYNGKTTTTKTGFDEDSDKIAKVDLVASKMTKTTVKFAFNIKVTNEGELPGYAYEVKDYIPKGLKFVAEENPDWKELEDGTVVTEKLKDTLLNPGESATVEIVLTWKNSTTNTGLKTNYAEISKDSAEDFDSMPDNYDFTEDDIDDAQVILSIKTAGAPTYIGLILVTFAILAGGTTLIKKYVIG